MKNGGGGRAELNSIVLVGLNHTRHTLKGGGGT